MSSTLEDSEVQELKRVFPELSWMEDSDWQSVASFADWKSWVDEWFHQEEFHEDDSKALYRMLKLRRNRVKVRKDCRAYFGWESVPNINDPEDPTWA